MNEDDAPIDDPAAGDAPPPEPEPEADASPPRRPGRRTVVVVAVVVALVAGIGAAFAAFRGPGCPPDGAVVEVRGRVVTEAEYERRVELLEALYGVQRPGRGQRQRADTFRRDAAKAVAMAAVVDAEVAARDLKAAEKAVRDALDRFVAERFPDGGRAGFVEALGNEGVSEADVLDEFRRLLETNRLYQAVVAGIEVTDDDVAAAFEERKENLALPERRRLRHLVVKTEEEAGAALARIQGGEAFAAVASAVSLDASTKAEGGALGFLTEAELDRAFAGAAFRAPTGQPFGPVETDRGWHVGVVEEVTPGRPVTLGEVRDSLREQLLGERRLARWRGFLAGQIKEADACYADRFRPADPDAPPPDVTPGLQP